MTPLKLKRPVAATAFFWALLCGIAVLLPIVLLGAGQLAFGNGNTQQLQLYQQAHTAIYSGQFGWCSTAGLGSGFVDGYACGVLGSPFFWLTLPFPCDWLPYCMAPLLALKIACAACTAALFSKRHLAPEKAVSAGILYALGCGFLSVVLMDVFPDALIWFPLLLLGVERRMQGQRRGLFALALLMTTLACGRFAPAQLPLCLLYWLARRRRYSRYQRHQNRRLFGLWAEGVLGLAGGAVLAMPDLYRLFSTEGFSALLGLWQPAAIAGGCLLVFGFLARWREQQTRAFLSAVIAGCMWLSVVGGWGWLTYQKIAAPAATPQSLPTPTFDLPQEYARFDAYGTISHTGLYEKYAFGDSRAATNVYASLESDTEPVALRNLLSVRWLVEDSTQLDEQHAAFETDGNTALTGWRYYATQQGYAIYENTLFIPMGFTYDSYITRSEYDLLTPQQRDLALLKSLVVEDADQSTIENRLSHRNTEWMSFSMAQYPADCADRAANAADRFESTPTGFRATIALDSPQVVFFSIPYNSGWSATVNGQPATLLQANLDFIAVVCPAGESVDICLDYCPPALRVGGIISAVGLVLMGLYWLILCRRQKVTEPEDDVPLPDPTPGPDGFDLYAPYVPKEDEENSNEEQEEVVEEDEE